MTINKLLVSIAAFMSLQAFSSPIAGLWQGPCETRGELSVKFTYDISTLDENNQGRIAKTKMYFNDDACNVHSRTARQTVLYTLGEPSTDGIYPLDVTHRSNLLYDIVTISEDGQILTFGEKFSSLPENRPTTLSKDNRVFVRITE